MNSDFKGLKFIKFRKTHVIKMTGKKRRKMLLKLSGQNYHSSSVSKRKYSCIYLAYPEWTAFPIWTMFQNSPIFCLAVVRQIPRKAGVVHTSVRLGRMMDLRQAWATCEVQDQPGPHGKALSQKSKRGLQVWLKWQSVCFANLKLWVQTPLPPKEFKKRKNLKGNKKKTPT
jgi:hypothetical protein